ncbi:MAG TPA: ATP-binding protein [Bacteroidales bacterium]|nr:ATP-binding protein [Bacteroidales bacterium]
MKSLALNILDIVQNSVRAQATEISIGIAEISRDNLLVIEIKDNGNGIPDELIDKVTDPFVTTRSTRKIGLGLPLLKFHSELAGGRTEITSEPGKGTVVKATFRLSHPDRQPLGDIAGVITMLMAANPATGFEYCHVTPEGIFSLSSKEIISNFENESLNDSSFLQDLKQYVISNLESIGADGAVK